MKYISWVVRFTQHEIHHGNHFKTVFSTFAMLCDCCHSPSPSQRNLRGSSSNSRFSTTPGNCRSAFCLSGFALYGDVIQVEFIQYVGFDVRLLLLRVMFSRFIRVVAQVGSSFLSMNEWYSMVWICQTLFIHWWTFLPFQSFSCCE